MAALKMGIRVPTRRALGRIRGGNVDEARSLVHVGARSSQPLWGSCRLVYLLVALPGQPSPSISLL